MNPLKEPSHEQISALADDGLQGHELAQAVDALCADPALQRAWQDYHAIGDVLATGTGARRPCSDGAAFLSRFQQRLAAEAPLAAVALEPVSSVVPFPARPPAQVETPAADRIEAANEPVFRWKLVSGVASLAAVAAIGWNLVGGTGATATDAQLAQQRVQAPVQMASREAEAVSAGVRSADASASGGDSRDTASTRVLAGGAEPQVMLRDARLDQLLEAHRQAGGAAQMPSGFLRNATFDGPSR